MAHVCAASCMVIRPDQESSVHALMAPPQTICKGGTRMLFSARPSVPTLHMVCGCCFTVMLMSYAHPTRMHAV